MFSKTVWRPFAKPKLAWVVPILDLIGQCELICYVQFLGIPNHQHHIKNLIYGYWLRLSCLYGLKNAFGSLMRGGCCVESRWLEVAFFKRHPSLEFLLYFLALGKWRAAWNTFVFWWFFSVCCLHSSHEGRSEKPFIVRAHKLDCVGIIPLLFQGCERDLE